MTPDVKIHMVGSNFSFEVWDNIERMFSSESKAKFLQYKLQLQTTKIGGLSMAEYLLKMKGYADALAIAGFHIAKEYHVLHILSGHNFDYDAFVIYVATQIEP